MSATARPLPRRSTARWPSRPCGRSPVATGRRSYDQAIGRLPETSRRGDPPVSGPQAGSGPEVRGGGEGAPAPGSLPRRTGRPRARTGHAGPARGVPGFATAYHPAELQPPARDRGSPRRLAGGTGAPGAFTPPGQATAPDRPADPVPLRPGHGPPAARGGEPPAG